jgi:hypothetical protein
MPNFLVLASILFQRWLIQPIPPRSSRILYKEKKTNEKFLAKGPIFI